MIRQQILQETALLTYGRVPRKRTQIKSHDRRRGSSSLRTNNKKAETEGSIRAIGQDRQTLLPTS
jgi:hypothetical protein